MLPILPVDGDLEHTLSQIALSMTQEYYNLSPDQAAAQSESTEIPAYYIATATSAMYLLLEKYGSRRKQNRWTSHA